MRLLLALGDFELVDKIGIKQMYFVSRIVFFVKEEAV